MKRYSELFQDNTPEILKKKFQTADLDLFDYALWKNGIDGLIATTNVFAPDFVEIDGYVFLYQTIKYNDYENSDFIIDLKNRFGTKKEIERYTNCICLGDLFINSDTKLLDDEFVLNKFTECLSYFWKIHLKHLFPQRKFIIEKGLDLCGDLGLCLTIYEDCDE